MATKVGGSVGVTCDEKRPEHPAQAEGAEQAEPEAEAELDQAALEDQPRHLASLRAQRHADPISAVRCVTE